ncbi:MAG: hypothetical protein P8X78_05730 [Nitrosopumilaceae archaeon]
MTNQNKTIFAGLIMMAAILSVSITYDNAFAQGQEREVNLEERPLRTGTFLVGSGAAVSEDDNAMRSHFRMGIVETQTNDSGHTEYEVKRGVFFVGKHDNRQHFSVIADTWKVSVSPNQKSFDASGQVENQEGLVYEVEISGEEISDLENGNLYFVSGTATGNGEVYELFYISGLVDRTAIQSASSGI